MGEEKPVAARAPGVSWDISNMPFQGAMPMGKTKDGKELSLASVLERQWGIEDRQVGLMEDQFWAGVGGASLQAVSQIFSGVLTYMMANAQIDIQDRAMTLQEEVTRHKIVLDLDMVAKTDALENKKLNNELQLARTEKNRAIQLAQIQEDGKTERFGKKMVASQFLAAYNYGHTSQARAV